MRIAALLGAYAVVGGVVSFLGWMLDVEPMADWFGIGIAIQPNTAIAAAFAGIALIFASAGWPRAVVASALVVGFIGFATTVEHVTGIDLPIDEIFTFNREWGSMATTAPGRMGPPAAASWAILSLAIFFTVSRRHRPLGPYLGLLVSVVASLSLIGAMFGASKLYMLPSITAIALQTSTFTLAIGLGMVAVAPDLQPMRTLLSPTGAGMLARRMLPIIILLPLAIGWVRFQGQSLDYFDWQFGTALRTIIEIVLFSLLLAWAVRAVRNRETEIVETNEALAQRERELSDFFENASVALHWVGPDGTILRANQAELDLLGYTREEYFGRNIAEFHVSGETIADVLSTLLRGEAVTARPAQLRRKDGSTCDVLINSSALIRDGRFIHTRCFTHDITELRRAQEDQARLAAIVESSDDAIISKALDGEILSWNAGAERMFGYTADEAIGQPVTLIVPPELLETENQLLATLARGERIDHFETQRLAKDGRKLNLSITVSPIRDASGQIIGSSNVGRDISERLQVEEALREADRRKDEFLAVLAHELRNPLAPISNSLQLIKLAGGNQELAAEARDMAERQVTHMVRLIDDLLDISRITRNVINLQTRPLDVVAAVAEHVEAFRKTADEHELSMSTHLPDRPIYVEADPVRFSQIINNLLANACKYTEAGGKITAAIAAAGDEVEIHVTDTGIGVPKDMLEPIFEMFTQVETTGFRGDGGLGIGLALASRLAELHGGSIKARSEGIGKGTEFIVTLPRTEAAPAERPVEPKRSVGLNELRVLVVDDNIDSMETMELLVQMHGCKTATASDGRGAIETAREYQPDVILLDIGLPEVSGLDVCRAIRKESWGRDITIVAMTGWGQAEDIQASHEAGFDHHLVKPIDPEKLLAILSGTQNAVGTN